MVMVHETKRRTVRDVQLRGWLNRDNKTAVYAVLWNGDLVHVYDIEISRDVVKSRTVVEVYGYRDSLNYRTLVERTEIPIRSKKGDGRALRKFCKRLREDMMSQQVLYEEEHPVNGKILYQTEVAGYGDEILPPGTLDAERMQGMRAEEPGEIKGDVAHPEYMDFIRELLPQATRVYIGGVKSGILGGALEGEHLSSENADLAGRIAKGESGLYMVLEFRNRVYVAISPFADNAVYATKLLEELYNDKQTAMRSPEVTRICRQGNWMERVKEFAGEGEQE
ncbi:MAG: hypothetical protein HYW25_00210 [Candidatus Aenigmarchaeota archaeon]|nr:hypothetical protein [Candidatus Aenigmarchaeota archaeon]